MILLAMRPILNYLQNNKEIDFCIFLNNNSPIDVVSQKTESPKTVQVKQILSICITMCFMEVDIKLYAVQ